MDHLRSRRPIHLSFSVAVVALVTFGTFGPVVTAAVGWIGALLAVGAWFAYAMIDARRVSSLTARD